MYKWVLANCWRILTKNWVLQCDEQASVAEGEVKSKGKYTVVLKTELCASSCQPLSTSDRGQDFNLTIMSHIIM